VATLPNRGIAMGMGAVAAAVAEFEAELRLQSQGIRMRSIEYTCGAAQAPKAMTVFVPKEMPPAEIEQKINAENVTGNGPWWRMSPDKTCPCDHQSDRMHYLLLETVDR
jgi:hypothetical protein